MIDWVLEPLEKIIKGAHNLAGLSSCDIWALSTLGLATYIGWDKRDRMKKEEAWLSIRTQQLEEEGKKIAVMDKMADELAGLKMIVTKYLIEKA